jgi:phosphoribosylglycinamide formyltransferase-1
VLPGDDEAALAARVLAAEHRAYPLALRLIAEGRVRIEGDRCVIDGAAAHDGVLMNPSDR